MRKITLELLRHGPPHNQLLSPLTNYLALCENHGAVTVHVPFEHNQMLYRLRALSYQMGAEPREFQILDTARVLGELLSHIPGLTADLNRHDGVETEPVTHLRLILSASELALLPFELATSPNGFPGAGQPLSLQTQQPVCITRETRRVPEEFIRWPKEPRILFAYASPAGLEPVPAQAHLLALRNALAPWLALSDDLDDDGREREVAKRLAVLADVTVPALEKACAENDYTHVHILAHGVEMRGPYDQRFGLALHDNADPAGWDVVSGERLATILRTPRRNQPGSFTRPAVVTLASCNGGNVGTVTGVGASIGHSLHESGIPLVVASQYPLSFGGSVMMVKDLYEGLFWGEDPRKLIVGMRRRLYSCFKDKHDWASVVAYASLPPDFDSQLADACIQQAMGSINVALRIADRAIDAPLAQRLKMIERVQPQVADAKRRLENAIKTYPQQQARILAQLASTEKREAEMLFHADRTKGTGENDRQVLEKLARSRDCYWKAYLLNRSDPWKLVQYVSLTLLLQKLGRLPEPIQRPEQHLASLWLSAEVHSANNAQSAKVEERTWAQGNLMELYLLAPFVDDLPPSHRRAEFAAKALHAAREVERLAGASSFFVFSTRRQVLRYLHWFVPMAGDAFPGLAHAAGQVCDALPKGDEPEWNY